jgi:hypothetical protein
MGGVSLPYKSVSATYTVDADYDYFIDCSTGTFTVSLPDATSITARTFIIKNSGSGVITVDPHSAQTIDGAATISLSQYASVWVQSNGTNWVVGGPVGEQGSQGDQGGNGAQGYQGNIGSQGEQGTFGAQGEQGNNGSQGEQGTFGAQGEQGTFGAQGDQGNQGEQGTFGAQGEQGNNGAQGEQGNQGEQGIFGAQGEQGTFGAQGEQGNQGEQGTFGAQGEQGNQGEQGTFGAQGEQGTFGAQGEQGNQGEQGTFGAQGEQGTFGAQGEQGTFGAQGEQGTFGAQGEQGTFGAQGDQGNQGDQGPAYANTATITSQSANYVVFSYADTYAKAVFIDYYVTNGSSHSRSGTITGVINSSANTVNFTDTSVDDLGGDTSGIAFSLAITSNQLELTAVITAGTWTGVVGIRSLN